MKPISALALLTIAASFAIPAASAQEVALKAQIPFAFTAGTTSLPAGSYTVSSPMTGVVRLVGQHGEYAAISSSRSLDEAKKGEHALVFDKVGQQYFLHQIICPEALSMNVKIPVWNAERNARERQALLKTAEPVLVMATLIH